MTEEKLHRDSNCFLMLIIRSTYVSHEIELPTQSTHRSILLLLLLWFWIMILYFQPRYCWQFSPWYRGKQNVEHWVSCHRGRSKNYSVLNVEPYLRQNQTEPDTNYLLAKKNQKLEVCWPKKSLDMFWLLMMNRLCLRSVISRSWLENLRYSSLRLAGLVRRDKKFVYGCFSKSGEKRTTSAWNWLQRWANDCCI